MDSALPACLLIVACLADFWALPENRLTNPLTQRVEKAFYSRCPPESRPTFLFEDSEKLSSTRTHEPPDDVSRVSSKQPEKKVEEDVEATAVGGDTEKTQTEPQTKTGKENKPEYDSSLLKALHSVFWSQFWLDRKSTRLNSSHSGESRMPSSA